MKFRLLALFIVGILLLGVAMPSVLADGALPGRAGRAEVRFLEGMIDHHQMALDMAEDCLKKTKTDSVKKLCQDVITAQSAEIKTMRGWLLVWYQVEYNPMPMSHMMDMMKDSKHGMMMGGMNRGGMMGGGMMGGTATPGAGGMGGMMQMPDDPPGMMGMMSGLSKLSGIEYDAAWLEAMIDHHDDALNMSNRVLKIAEHKELRALAEKIVKDQTAEIKTMEEMIAQLTKK